MRGFENPEKLFLMLGAVFLVLGAVLTLAGKIGWIGRLPGDIRIERENFSFYFPLATCLLLSLLLTLILNLFRRF